MASHFIRTSYSTATSMPAARAAPACDYEGWDLDTLNAEVDVLRKIRAKHGVGAMLAHASGVPLDEWHAGHGIDRPAGG